MTSLSGPVGVTVADTTGAPMSVCGATAGAKVQAATCGSVTNGIERQPLLAMGSVSTDSGPAAVLVVAPASGDTSTTLPFDSPPNAGAVNVSAAADGMRQRVRLASTS